jgi:hypothetical protein
MGTSLPAWMSYLIQKYAGYDFTKRGKAHGIGLNSRQEIERLTLQDLQYLSDVLSNNKKFILGQYPSECDCTVFGHLAQAMWGSPGSIYENALKSKRRIKTF